VARGDILPLASDPVFTNGKLPSLLNLQGQGAARAWTFCELNAASPEPYAGLPWVGGQIVWIWPSIVIASGASDICLRGLRQGDMKGWTARYITDCLVTYDKSFSPYATASDQSLYLKQCTPRNRP